MTKKITTIAIICICLLSCLSPELVLAQNQQNQNGDLQSGINKQLQAGSGRSEDVEPADPRLVVANLIQWALGLLGTVFLVLLLMSGYWLVTARGREDHINKARKTALRATVGLVIVLLSYSVTVFVTGALQDAAGLEGAPQEDEATDWRDIDDAI